MQSILGCYSRHGSGDGRVVNAFSHGLLFGYVVPGELRSLSAFGGFAVVCRRMMPMIHNLWLVGGVACSALWRILNLEEIVSKRTNEVTRERR